MGLSVKGLPVCQPMKLLSFGRHGAAVSPDFISRLDERHEVTQTQQIITERHE